MKGINEELISYAENELMDKERMRRRVLAERPLDMGRAPKLRKALMPLAACLVLVFVAVFAIPSARAEVLSWFGIVKTPAEYLNQEPGERIPIEALDSLIVKPVNDANGETGSVTNNRVITAADEPIWQSIADNFSAELGETLVDGDKLYLTLKLQGLTALPIVDGFIGGNATRAMIPAEHLPEIFPSGVPEEYLNGEANCWEAADSRIMLVLEDGTAMRFLYNIDDEYFGELFDRKQAEFGAVAEFADDETMEQLSRMCMEWLDGRTVPMTVACDIETIECDGRLVDDPVEFLSRYADENGILHAKAVYRAVNYYPAPAVKLEADLGEACFDVKSFLGFENSSISAEVSEITLSKLETILTCESWDNLNTTLSMTNVKVDLSGVKLTPESAYSDALGVHEAAFAITFPEGWTDEMCESFVFALDFSAEADGSPITIESFGREKLGEREYRIVFDLIHLPYDSIENTRTIKIVPELYYRTEVYKDDVKISDMALGETVVVKPLTHEYSCVGGTTVLSGAEMVFVVGD